MLSDQDILDKIPHQFGPSRLSQDRWLRDYGADCWSDLCDTYLPNEQFRLADAAKILLPTFALKGATDRLRATLKYIQLEWLIRNENYMPIRRKNPQFWYLTDETLE